MVTQLVDTHTLEALVAPVVEAEGLALVSVQLRRESGGAILRVLLEHAEQTNGEPSIEGAAEVSSGVSLADCTRVSRALSVVLDEHDALFPSAYSLEVSSAGIERPLVKAKDYLRFVGREAHISTRGHGAREERKNFSGKLVGLDGDEVILRDPEGKDLKIALGEISKAHLVHRF
jgi:ribosome maturation factor RimP